MQGAEHAPRIRRLAVCLMLLLSFAVPARSDRRQLEDALKPVFQNKVVFLRGFYSNAKLRFDRNGDLVSNAATGFWTVNSTILISDLRIDRHNLLTLKAKRVINVFDDATGKFVNLTSDKSVQIEIELDPAWQDAAPVLALLGKVIPSSFGELSATVPAYWQCWLSGHPTRDKENGNWQCSLPNVEPHKAGEAEAAKTEACVSRALKVGGSVKPPRVLSKADPTFTDAARFLHLQGITVLRIIVDEHGEPRVTEIVRPLGAGLDDQAVECVRHWRFAPATRDGEPVPVEVNVEVSYHLYK
jgi:TonB family protein